MEYLGIPLEEDEAWIVSAFKATLNLYKEMKVSDNLDDEQKRLLFVMFYAGISYGKGAGEIMGG